MNRPAWAVRQAHEEIWYSAFHNAADWLRAIDRRVDELVARRELARGGDGGVIQGMNRTTGGWIGQP